MSPQRAGFSLVETMVAIALLGVIIVTVLSAFSSASIAANRHGLDTSLDRLVRSDAEFVKSQAYQPKPGVYANLAVPGFAFAVQILYYNGATKTFLAANAEAGLQEIVLTATAPGGASEKLFFLKVRP